MSIEKLPRTPMRREDEPGYEKEIWQPKWDCFCCHDTGIIVSHLAGMVIDGYDHNHDKFPRCVNPGCRAGSHWDSEGLTGCIDYRLSAAVCLHLDTIEREDWRRAVEAKAELVQSAITDTAKNMSFRRLKRDRTPAENKEVQRRYEEACNAEPQKLREMARAYLGNEYMKDGPS